MLLVVFSVATEPVLRYLNLIVEGIAAFVKKQKAIMRLRAKQKAAGKMLK